MRLLLINPNVSPDMTRQIAHEAAAYCHGQTRIAAVTAAFGCAVIATRASYAIAAHAALDTFAQHAADADAVLLACFGDPGLEALCEIARVPVIGMLAASVQEAASDDRRFAIVTAGAGWIPMLQERVRLSGHAHAMVGIHAVQATGLQISRDPQAAMGPLQQAVDDATRAGAQAIILGGSALAGFGRHLRSTATLLDPLASAMTAAQRPVPVAVGCMARLKLESTGLSQPLHDALLSTPRA